MKTNITLGRADVIVLSIVFIMMAIGVRLVIGFFHEGKPKKLQASTYNGKGQTRMILQIDGMMCGQCESHINSVVRKTFPEVEKVTSSHTKGETVIIAEHLLDEKQLKGAIGELGYEVLNIYASNYRPSFLAKH